jgi:hypothetical protein
MADLHTAGRCRKPGCRMVHSFTGAKDLNEHEQAAERSDPLQAALATIAELRERLAEAEAVIAGLRAELDRAGGHDVYVCMERDRQMMVSQLTGVRSGTVLRFTDSDRELVLDEDGHWVARQPA